MASINIIQIKMKKIKSFVDIVAKLNHLLNKKQRLQSIKAFFWMIISSVFEMMSISIIIPFISVILSPKELTQNYYINKLIAWFKIETYFELLILLVVGIIVIYFLKNVILLYSKSVQIKYQCQIQEELSMLMLDSFMNRPYSYFVNSNSSEIMRGVIDDIENIFTIIQTLFSMIAESLTVILIVIYIIYTDCVMAFGIVLIAGGILLLLTMGFKNILKREGVHYRDLNLKKNRDILQISQGIKDIYVMQRKDYFVNKFKKSYDEFKKSRIIYNIVLACPERIIETVFIGSILFIVCVRIGQGVEVSAFIPQLGAFAVAGYRLLPSISKFSNGINQIIFVIPALNAAYDNVKNAKKYLGMTQNTQNSNNGLLTFEKSINIENVTWSYDESENIILSDVSVDIHKGDSVAFIGESGSGKSTLADIILGLYKPHFGKVLCDNREINLNLKEWAGIISYVPQNVFLLDDTVKANVVFGHNIIDEEKIWNALEQAQLKSFIESLPNGLNTMVGEAGVKFSGGQRQRIAIARALYCEPDILLLDEATAALDNDTESAVMEAIDSLKGKKTLIIIAHRLSTIKNCNKVYEVKKHKIYDVTDIYC